MTESEDPENFERNLESHVFNLAQYWMLIGYSFLVSLNLAINHLADRMPTRGGHAVQMSRKIFVLKPPEN